MESMIPFFSESKREQIATILDGYRAIYQGEFVKLFGAKLGLKTTEEKADMALLAELLDLMELKSADFTQAFRDLSELSLADLREGKVPESAWGLKRMKGTKEFDKFLEMYTARLDKEGTSDEERMILMQKSNPRYILRNWLAQRAIEMAEKDDFSEVEKLLRVLKNPFKVQREAEEADYARPPPSWSSLLRVSCSS